MLKVTAPKTALGLVLAVMVFAGSQSRAQSPTPTPTATPAPTPIPSAQIVAAAETDLALLSTLSGGTTTTDTSLDQAKQRLAGITSEIRSNSANLPQILKTAGSSPALQTDENRFIALNSELRDIQKELKTLASGLDDAAHTVSSMTARWTVTQKADHSLPPTVASRVQTILNQLGTEGSLSASRESAIIELQNDVADRQASVQKSISAIDEARSAALSRLLVQDSRPLWEMHDTETSHALTPQSPDIQALTRETETYAMEQWPRFILHLAIWAALIGLFAWLRREAREWMDAATEPSRAAEVFEIPVASASIAALCLTSVIYPEAPGPLHAIFGALLLPPLFIVIRRLVEPSLAPLAWALIVCYLANLVHDATASLPFVARLVLLFETVFATCLAIWLRGLTRRTGKVAPKFQIAALNLAAAAFLFATGANVTGYASLALFTTHSVLFAAFLALMLYTGTRILEGLLAFALHVPPLSLLGAVQRHRIPIELRTAWFLRVAAMVLWLALMLERFSLLNPLTASIGELLSQKIVFGPVSAASIIEFVLTVWAAFLVSRFIRFVLDEEVYRRIRLAPGMPFAISTLLHYAILLAGFYLAAAILVGDMTKFTILAGAFSVGIGFGLQNIVNNFVSGIIVLFERPVKLGDVIQVSGNTGAVERIGIRATAIRTTDGSEIIIPNGTLISDPLTNWTLAGRQRQIDVAIATPNTADARLVIASLAEAAVSVHGVSEQPAPYAELTKVGGGTFNFELHAYTTDLEHWSAVRSELTLSVYSTLQKKGVTIS